MSILLYLLCLVSSSYGFQLFFIANPFTGTWTTNTYEYFDGGFGPLLTNPVSLWLGTGVGQSADTTKLFYGLVNPGAYNGVCSLAPRFGTHVFVTLAKVEFSWDHPLYAFGGYWGANNNNNGPNPVIFDFYDINNVLLASTTENINNNCSWFWRSWGFSDPIVSKVIITGPEQGGLVVTDQIRVSDTNVYVPGGSTGTTGTTGTTGFPGGIPACNVSNSITFSNRGTQYDVNNDITAPANLAAQFEIKSGSSDFVQSFFSRQSFPASRSLARTRFKSRLDSIIEFLDDGSSLDDGYKPNNDTLIKESTFTSLGISFKAWSDDDGNTFTATLPSTGPTIMVFHGRIQYATSACAGYPLVPNIASLTVDIDWTKQWTRPNTKIALKVLYTLYEDITNETTNADPQTVFVGDQRQRIYDEFYPIGQPSVVTTEAGSIPILFYDTTVGGGGVQPEYQAYYTIDTTDHTLQFTSFHLVDIKPPNFVGV